MRRLPLFSTIMLLYLLVLCHFQAPTLAMEKSYIVYMGSHAHGPDPTLSDIETASASHYELLESVCKSMEKAKEKILYSYTQSINGFAAILEEGEAAELAKHPGVVSVFLNKGLELRTTHSWSFLGLEGEGFIPKSSLWRRARFGKDVIIANIDTGVWPESKSFSDEEMSPIPSRWRGFCSNDSTGVRCNRKLISARYFNNGVLAANVSTRGTNYYTSRDTLGHGTHTLSTAAGNFVPGANAFGLAEGTAKGGSPNARVAAYKACWDTISGNLCYPADILAAMDAAIYDGVDVISISIGSGGEEIYDDVLAIGAFHAIQRGIVVVASAGNDGPMWGTVENVAPWLLTVGAATIDRQFTSYVTLGNGKRLNGVSLSTNGSAAQKFYPLILGEKASNHSARAISVCGYGALDPEKAKGKILVCPLGKDFRDYLEMEALRTGAAGMIVTNEEDSDNKIMAHQYKIPAADLNIIDSNLTFAYVNSTKNPVALIGGSRTVFKAKPAPAVPDFSARGPNPFDQWILKPDIVAPGVNIIASNSLASEAENHGPFVFMSGTSMSTPHVAGVVGLLRELHPDWSPAAVQSAIITTARTLDNNGQHLLDLFDNSKATPFTCGAGFLDPNGAADPGLVYDLLVDDYLNYLCAHGYDQRQIRLISSKTYLCPKTSSLADFNYPSITVPNLNSSVTIKRTVKNVGSPSKYTVHVTAPKGALVSVNPETLEFTRAGEAKQFLVTVRADREQRPKGYVFGSLTWSDGKHKVRSPLIVKYQ